MLATSVYQPISSTYIQDLFTNASPPRITCQIFHFAIIKIVPYRGDATNLKELDVKEPKPR